jgi:heavy metal sensor kinase
MTLKSLSIRSRLSFWHAAVLTLIVCAFSGGTYYFVNTQLCADADEELGRTLASVRRVYRDDPGQIKDLELRFAIPFFRIANPGAPGFRSVGWQRDGLDRALEGGSVPVPKPWTSPEGRRYRVQTISEPDLQVAVASDESALRRTLRTLAIALGLGVPFAAAFAILGGYFLAGRLLLPLGTMAEKARKITAESLGEKLPVKNPNDELGRLALVFNDTLARLHDSFERLRGFTADVSHELRTPLTAMKIVGEVALRTPLDPVASREVIGSMLEEVDRLTRLVDTLLTLTRADSGAVPINRELVDLGDLASSAAENLRVLAEEKQQSLTVEAAQSVDAKCDPTILRQGLLNLIHNAIKYTPRGGAIKLRVAKLSARTTAIEVEDSGPGIPLAQRARIFERFYRGDAGRSRDVGGAGLGLAIARWAAEANAGTVELKTEDGKGCLFRIILPAATG